MSAREQTAELLARLERHYIRPGEALPGGVFVPECGINGGGRGSRADALYVGFTSTSGRLLVGHEIKVSRADWRKELDQAGKADFWADTCHQWWIVAPGPEVVPVEEVPHQWGLMYPSARTTTRMQVVRAAKTWPDRSPSWDAVRSIVARLDTLRAGREYEVREKAVKAARAEAERLETERMLRGEREALTPEQQRRLNQLEWIEKLLGEPLNVGFDDAGVRPEHAAAVLRLVRAADEMHADPRYSASHLERAAVELLKGLAGWTDAMAALAEITVRNRP